MGLQREDEDADAENAQRQWQSAADTFPSTVRNFGALPVTLPPDLRIAISNNVVSFVPSWFQARPMNTLSQFRCYRAVATFLAISLFLVAPRETASAADHLEAPIVSGDLGADLNGVYGFRDPTDNSTLVLIATMHGFIVPGEGPNAGGFDPNVIYRFEIYNDHVNLDSPVLDPEATRNEKKAFLQKVKPNLLIDVAFSKREVGPEPQPNATGGTIPANLRRPKAQAATVKFLSLIHI